MLLRFYSTEEHHIDSDNSRNGSRAKIHPFNHLLVRKSSTGPSRVISLLIVISLLGFLEDVPSTGITDSIRGLVR